MGEADGVLPCVERLGLEEEQREEGEKKQRGAFHGANLLPLRREAWCIRAFSVGLRGDVRANCCASEVEHTQRAGFGE